MTATAHVLIGGIIASSVQNQPLGLGLAFVSHPFLDMVPHWDFGWGWKKKTKLLLTIQALGDLGLGIVLAFIFFYSSQIDLIYFLAAIFLSTVWDVSVGPYLIFNWKFPPFNWLYKFKSSIQGKAKLPWGVITQVVTIILFIVVLENLNL